MNTYHLPVVSSLAIACYIIAAPIQVGAQTYRKHVLAVGIPESNPQTASATTASADLFVKSLELHAGVSRARGDQLTVLTGRHSVTDKPPTKARILTAIKTLLRSVEPQDEIWFYYCGHGLISNGVSNLVPYDAVEELKSGQSKSANLLPVRTIAAELAKVSARRKVMILDCCQTDVPDLLSDWSPSDPNSQWLSELQQIPVEIVSSCGPGQASLLWPSKQRALFTWWLCHGLKGAADTNRDSRMSLKELVTFTQQRVHQSMPVVKAEICRRANLSPARAPAQLFTQTPQYWPAGSQLGDDPSFELTETSFHQSLTALTDLTNDLILLESATWKQSAPPTVAIGEFLEVAGNTPQLRGQNGLFGKLAADRLTDHLIDVRSDRYLVMKPAEVAKYLLDIGIRARHEPDSWAKAASDYFVDTTFVVECERRRIHLTSSLFDCKSGEQLNTMTSLVRVNRELESVLGTEIHWPPPESKQPPAAAHSKVSKPTGPNTGQGPHPTTAESRQRRTKIPHLDVSILRRQPAESRFQHSAMRDRIEVHKGDQLTIRLRNTSDQRAAVVALVDGTSVLKMKSGLTPQECVQQNLYFIMEPRAVNSLSGFMKQTSQIGQDGKADFDIGHFQVVDAPQSVSAQNRYGKDFGEIRIVVYPVQPAKRAHGRGAEFGIGVGHHAEQRITPETRWVADVSGGCEIHAFRYFSAQN